MGRAGTAGRMASVNTEEEFRMGQRALVDPACRSEAEREHDIKGEIKVHWFNIFKMLSTDMCLKTLP